MPSKRLMIRRGAGFGALPSLRAQSTNVAGAVDFAAFVDDGSRDRASKFRKQRAKQTDEMLFEMVARERNEEAFSELYDRFAPRVYALSLHMLRTEEDAQDLMQEIFVLIWQKAPLYLETRGNVAAWIISIARNRAVDLVRSKHYRERSLESELVLDDRPEIDRLLVDGRMPDGELNAADAKREVELALLDLTADQRKVVDLAYFGGKTHTEIATQLGMPVGTVKTRMRQAVMTLAKRLRPLF